MNAPQTQATVNPPTRPAHNDMYWNAFEERCRLQGWTERQIAERKAMYFKTFQPKP